MIINNHLRVIKPILLLLVLFLCAAAADFPDVKPGQFDPFSDEPFRMDEFDRAKKDTSGSDKDPDPFERLPKVAEREYTRDEKEVRLPIEKIIIEGVIPHPELEITQELIQQEINSRLIEEIGRDRDINGFTSRDLEDIGGYIRGILDRGGIRGGVDREDIVKLLLRVQEWEEQETWITLEQLDSMALMVTEYYRERGFILATAFIPEQEVTNGEIRMNVLEGRLGEVIVSNHQIFDPKVISAAFNNEIGKPVTEERVESALRRINDLPGVQVRGSFSPGDNVGETRLNLGVLAEKTRNSNVLLDNHGSDATGVTRLFATTEWLNFLNKGHRLQVGVLRSEGPDSSIYGLVEYEMPVLNDGRGKFKVSASTNVFSVAASQTIPEIIGETNNYSLASSYQFVRSRTFNLSSQASYTYKDVLFSVGGISSLSTDQQIGVFSLGSNFTQLWDKQLLLLSGRVAVEQGQVYSGEVQDQSTNFTKTLVTMNLLKRFSLENWLTKKTSSYNLVFKANAQYAEKFLSSVEQFSLGGPTAVRAFGVSDVSVDSGVYAGIELFFDLPVDILGKLNLPLDPIKPFLFYDYAYGVARRPGGGDDKDGSIKGYGLGLRLNWSGRGSANLIFATPKSAYFEDDFSEAQGKSRVYFDVNYKIH
ncbi:MAG: hemolysin activation/secretion protein [Candidatus Azotimanducaceae bacterium]|jgi:hemolysin activation/secretion protein